MRFVLILGLLSCNGIGIAQAVCLGTTAGCREAQKHMCANEKAETNIVTNGAKSLRGDVRDQSGATFGSGYVVQLRDAARGQVLQASVLDSVGGFSFKDLPTARLRLIIVRVVDGKIVRPPLFDEPASLACQISRDCDIKIVLKAHGTDNPLDFCPPK